MRMWMIDPKFMCRKHLLGEHVECHMLLGSLKKKKNLTGFVDNGLIEIRSLQSRHSELVREMIRRGYNHNSPLTVTDEDLIGLGEYVLNSDVDKEKSLRDITDRCPDCCWVKHVAENEQNENN